MRSRCGKMHPQRPTPINQNRLDTTPVCRPAQAITLKEHVAAYEEAERPNRVIRTRRPNRRTAVRFLLTRTLPRERVRITTRIGTKPEFLGTALSPYEL